MPSDSKSIALICLLVTTGASAGFRYDLRFADGSKAKAAEPGTYQLDAIAIVWGNNSTPTDDGVMSGRLNLFSQPLGDAPFLGGGVTSAQQLSPMNNTSGGLGGVAFGAHIPTWSDDGIADWGSTQRLRGSTAPIDVNPLPLNLYYRGSSNSAYQGAPVVTGGGSVGSASTVVPGAWEVPVARFTVNFTPAQVKAVSAGATVFRLRGNNSSPGALGNWAYVKDGVLPPMVLGREYGASFDDAFVTFASAGYKTPPLVAPSQSSDYVGLAYEPVGPTFGSLGGDVLEKDVPDLLEGNLDLASIFASHSDSDFVIRLDLEGDLSGLPTDPNWQYLYIYPEDDFEIRLYPNNSQRRLDWLSWSTVGMPFVVDRVRIDFEPVIDPSVPEPSAIALVSFAAIWSLGRPGNKVRRQV